MHLRMICLVFSVFLVTTTASANPGTGKNGMVVSENIIASQIGAGILRAGGNAVDAAVAVGYALAVVSPCCGNIGGGGFMTLHLANGQNIFLNFREKAPLRATKTMFLNQQDHLLDDKTTQGYLAVAVPGTVLGFETALKKYGTMTRAQVMAPAIKLAQDGYVLTPYDVKLLQTKTAIFKSQPNVAAIFLNHGKPFQAGDRFIQKDLANTLSLIAKEGSDVFYKGVIAKKIVNASEQNGGILTLKDFTDYTVQELQPIQCQYRGYDIITAPPPSSGGVTLCEMLHILENFPLANLGYRSTASTQLLIETMRIGFYDRNNKLGDPDFMTNPVQELLSKTYAQTMSEHIKQIYFAPTQKSVAEHESMNTTHYSIVDNKGNAVALTYTLNGFFGAGVMAENTGFFLNDEMDDFATNPGKANKFGLVQHDANAIQPGKRPLSSMTPTIVMKNGQLYLVIGSPGGPRIITAVLLALLNVIDYDMDIQHAVDAARFHFQGEPDIINIEPFSIPYLTQLQLELRGYHFAIEHDWSNVEAILIDPKNKTLFGANDYRRRYGGAVGY